MIATTLALVGLLLAAWYWPDLPPDIPIHWGFDGQPDGWMPRQYGIAIAPLFSLLMPVLLYGLTRIGPRSPHTHANEPVVFVLSVMIATFGLALQVMTLQTATTTTQAVSLPVLYGLLGMLFLGMGLILPRVKSNFLLGIRTPWTLANDIVWRKTHRLGSYCFVAAGSAITVAGFLPPSQAWLVVCGAVSFAALIPVFASWLFARAQR